MESNNSLPNKFDTLIETCNALSSAISESDIAEKLFNEAKATTDRLSNEFRALQRDKSIKVNNPIIYPYKGEFYCLYSTEQMTFAEKAEFYKPE